MISGLICALACLDRYAGIFLVPVGSILIFFNKNIPLRRRIIHCLLFGGLSVSLFLIKYYPELSADWFSHRSAAEGKSWFFKNYRIFRWCLLRLDSILKMPGTATMLTLAVIVIFLLSNILFLQAKINRAISLNILSAATGLMYCVFMLLSSFLTRYEQFTNRLLAPMFIPLVWSLSWWIPGFIRKQNLPDKWIAGIFLLLLLARFINIQLAADYEFYDGVKDAGIPDYGEDEFALSGIVQFLEKNRTIFDSRFPDLFQCGGCRLFCDGPARHSASFSSISEKSQAVL